MELLLAVNPIPETDSQTTAVKTFGDLQVVRKQTHSVSEKSYLEERRKRILRGRDTIALFENFYTQSLVATTNGRPQPTERGRQFFQSFRNLLSWIEQEYFQNPKRKAPYANAINSFLQLAQDPHTQIHPHWAHDTLTSEEPSQTASVGAGITFSIFEEHAYVTQVVRNGPAEMAGVHKGDEIISVDGKPILQIADFQKLSQTQMTLVLLRQKQKIVVQVRLGPYQSPLVMTELLHTAPDLPIEEIFYVKISSFLDLKCSQLIDELEKLKVQSISTRTGIVLDLRDNGGGYLTNGVCLVGALAGPKMVARLEPINPLGQRKIYISDQSQILKGPIAVIINSLSASTSEVVAGALQDDGHYIVGARSFGKGSVQSDIPFLDDVRNGLDLRLTHSLYFLRKLWSPQIQGVTPNFQVFSTLGDSRSERELRMSEEDQYLQPLPQESKVWKEWREPEIKTLKACVDSNGTAKKDYKIHEVDGSFFDYQKAYAIDVLQCVEAQKVAGTKS